VRVARHRGLALGGGAHVVQDGERGPEEVVAGHRSGVELGGNHRRKLFLFGQIEALADLLAERVGEALEPPSGGRVALLGRELLADVQDDEVSHVGRERAALCDVGEVVFGPRGVRLLAPVEERLFSAVEALAPVEHDGAIALDRVRDGLVRPGDEGAAIVAREVLRRLPRAERPDDAIGRHRPRAARTRVLHDLFTGAVSAWGELEEQRRSRARRIHGAEAEVHRVGRVARPDVGPLLAGLEAPALGARECGPVLEGVVLDRRDRVLAHLGEREGVERIEHRALRLKARQVARLTDLARLRRRVALLDVGRQREAPHAGGAARRHVGLVGAVGERRRALCARGLDALGGRVAVEGHVAWRQRVDLGVTGWGDDGVGTAASVRGEGLVGSGVFRAAREEPEDDDGRGQQEGRGSHGRHSELRHGRCQRFFASEELTTGRFRSASAPADSGRVSALPRQGLPTSERNAARRRASARGSSS
jgi:hypothetical protein